MRSEKLTVKPQFLYKYYSVYWCHPSVCLLVNSAGLGGYFLRRVLEDAIMVKILMKMLIVSMYMPIDLQEGTKMTKH